MIREYSLWLDDSLKGFERDVDELERRFDAKENQGQWKIDGTVVSCSICGRFRRDCREGHTNYCNHCGAKMFK